MNRLRSLSLALASLPLLAAASFTAPLLAQTTNFYGKQVSFLKLFGQQKWGDISPGRVVPSELFHAAGVVVDRSATPNIIYVADTGNSRILGFRSFANTNADLIFGQPDGYSGAPNGDGISGSLGPTTRTNLCLLNVPENTNMAEQWGGLNLDVDALGNLYVPDYGNNRILVYHSPFSSDKTAGKGDVIPDRVIGQDNYTSNRVNHGLGYFNRDARSPNRRRMPLLNCRSAHRESFPLIKATTWSCKTTHTLSCGLSTTTLTPHGSGLCPTRVPRPLPTAR